MLPPNGADFKFWGKKSSDTLYYQMQQNFWYCTTLYHFENHVTCLCIWFLLLQRHPVNGCPVSILYPLSHKSTNTCQVSDHWSSKRMPSVSPILIASVFSMPRLTEATLFHLQVLRSWKGPRSVQKVTPHPHCWFWLLTEDNLAPVLNALQQVPVVQVRPTFSQRSWILNHASAIN